MTESLPAVSLFSNCGAGDLGYASAGFRFDVMAEIDKRRLEIALLNHRGAAGVEGDLRSEWPRVIDAYRRCQSDTAPALLAACPPCQGMSSARGGRGREDDPDAGSRDHRNVLVDVIAEVVHQLAPRAVVVENVPAFLTRLVNHPRSGKPVSAARLLTHRLQGKYRVFPFLTDLADYGVPQTRVRAFLTFVRRDEAGLTSFDESHHVPYPRPTVPREYGGSGHTTLRSALADLGAKALDAGSAELATDPEDPLHFVPVWGDDYRYRMVSAIEPGSGGRAWENSMCCSCGDVSAGPEDAICPSCAVPLRRPVVREDDGTYRLVRGFRTSSYSRMRPNVPASTVTTASGHVGSDRTIHPFENRVLSPRECAYLQTFPMDFEWGSALKRWGGSNVRAMIGEAVPPLFTELHGRAIRSVLDDDWQIAPASASDPRTEKARERLFRATATS